MVIQLASATFRGRAWIASAAIPSAREAAARSCQCWTSQPGITQPVRIHGLRHFYASGLIAAGCDVVTVQRALGHANATTTLNTYSHLWPTAEDRTRKASEAMMAAAAGNLADSARTRTP